MCTQTCCYATGSSVACASATLLALLLPRRLAALLLACVYNWHLMCMGKFPEMHEKTSCLVCKRMANSRQGRGLPATHPATRPPATATRTTPGHPATNDTPDHRPRPAGHPASRLSQPPGRPRPRPRPGHGHARKKAILGMRVGWGWDEGGMMGRRGWG